MKLENYTLNISNNITRAVSMFTLLFLTVFSSSLSGQCTLGCNNRVQVSLSADCMVAITPAMILEGEDTLNCAYTVEVLGPNDIPIPGSPVVTSDHVGMELKVRVTLTVTGNSCWGYIFIEDKQPPIIDCPTVADTVSCYFNGFLIPPTATDNCDGLAFVEVVSDEIVDLDCTELYSAERTIIYQATDSYGNKSPFCVRTVIYRRIPLDSILFPMNHDDLELPILECSDADPLIGSGWDLNDNYYPDPWVDLNENGQFDMGESESGIPTTTDGFPIFPNTSYCEINAAFSDKVIDICENSFKVLRNWTILDWCTSEVRDSFQIVKVLDSEDPIISCPEDNLTVYADPYDCDADWIVPAPIVIYDCSSTTYTVDYLLADNNGAPPLNGLYIDDNVIEIKDGQGNFLYYIIRDLPVGRTWVRYTVTDACDNSERCFTEVDVIDNVPPIPVCDEFTVVTLTTNGYAKVYAESFDDGSHDNCTPVGFDVRRMDRDVCDDDNDNNTTEADDYGPYVKFCCPDPGADPDIMVQLRVWDDANGDGIFGSKIPIYGDNEEIIGYWEDNFNTCMVVITVQDKIDPIIVCPPDLTVECGLHFDPEDLAATFGDVVIDDLTPDPFFIEDEFLHDYSGPLVNGYATDNCTVEVEEDSDVDLNQCNVGVITRIFTATDGGGRTSICVQTIRIVNYEPFDFGSIDPPNDITLDGCLDVSTDPEDLPAGFDYPDYTDDECSQLAATYEDQVFTFVDGVCFKILRKWTVIDWCQYDHDLSYDENRRAFWYYTQEIKIIDDEDPDITDKGDKSVCSFELDCEGFIDLANSAEDCTPEEDLNWSYEIDLFNDDEGDLITGNSNDASGTYPVGIHKITWTVEDMCGNQSTEMNLFIILDCKKPTPYCLSEITTVVMPSSGSIEIWAKDFDRGSTDNCSEEICFSFNNILPSFTYKDYGHYFDENGIVLNSNGKRAFFDADNTPDPSSQNAVADAGVIARYMNGEIQLWIPSRWSSAMVFTCEDVGNHDLDITAIDEAKNTDFCSVTINIQDNADCTDGGQTASLVSGNVRTSTNAAVEDVMVSLENMENNNMSYFLTLNDGAYGFSEIAMNKDYMVAAEKNDGYLNGVSTLDIVLIQRHILGIQQLGDPYKVVAADINNSKSVSASDLIQLRKLILGIYSELPNNASWRFIDAAQDFGDIEAPWDFSEQILLKDLSEPNNNNNFIGVKVGDVNGTAKVNARDINTGTRSAEVTNFILTDKNFRNGEMIDVEFRSDDINNILGYQMTLQLDAGALEFSDIREGAINMTLDNLGLTHTSEGLITVSWNDIVSPEVDDNEVLFTLSLRAKTNGSLSNSIAINSSMTTAEAYTSDLSATDINLEFAEEISGGVVLMQNRPNPFSESTIVSFVLPQEAQTTLSVYDISGRLLKKVASIFPAGRNNIDISAEELNASGVLYYQLETGSFKSTKKMILIEK